jgi:hypothetical protein
MRVSRLLRTAIAIALFFALAFSAPAQEPSEKLKQEVIVLDVRPRVSITYLGIAGSEAPKAAVVLLAGGKGALKLAPTGSMGTDLRGNFLIRSRGLFARQGLYVAALDAASDRQDGMDGAYRLSTEHAREIGRVIADLKQRAGVPVWLVGTSAGTLSTAGAASRLAPQDRLPRPHGIVLTSAMTQLDGAGYCGRSVYDASLSDFTGPVLLVSHQEDGCRCSPGIAAIGATVLARFSGSSVKEHKIFTGGNPPVSGPCDARSQHGFFGIENDVVKTIADWIKSH